MKPKLFALLVAGMIAALIFCASAGAANVLLGPSLDSPFVSESCGEDCSLFNLEVSEYGAELFSPVNGVILRWRLIEGITPGEYHLRIADRVEPDTYHFASTTPGFLSAATPGIQTFSFATPISIGRDQEVGLQMSGSASVGFARGLGSVIKAAPSPPDGTTQKLSWEGSNDVVGFDVEIQPEPTISSLSPASASVAGGATVTISGTDLENATSVTFNGIPAASYTVDSESKITAVTPANPVPAIAQSSDSVSSAPVMVTTVAGTALAQLSLVTPASPRIIPPASKTPKPRIKPVARCVVPNLKEKKLRAARAALKKGDCKAGKVTKLKGATPKTGKVAAQSRKPGVKATAGAKVNLTLKP